MKILLFSIPPSYFLSKAQVYYTTRILFKQHVLFLFESKSMVYLKMNVRDQEEYEMPFDGIALYAVVSELQNNIVGSRVMKIYQPKKDELWIFLYQNGQEFKLLVSVNSTNCRLHLTEEEISNPASPPMFCMILRKYLIGGRLKQIVQKDLERIVEITIQNNNEYMQHVEYRLIIEIMSKHSNIILVHADDNTIIDAIKRISSDINRYREILPGKVYIYPPLDDKISLLSFDRNLACDKLLQDYQNGNKNISRWLLDNFMGISGVSAKELASRVNINPEKELSSLTQKEKEILIDFMEKFSVDLKEKRFQPSLYKNSPSGSPDDFWVFPLTFHKKIIENLNVENNCVNKTIDFFYSKKQEMLDLLSNKNKIITELKKHLKKLRQNLMYAEKNIKETNDMKKYRLWGEMLSAFMYMVKPGMKEITLPNYEQGGEIVIPLNEKYSPSRNAQHYFDKYKKLNKARRIAQERKKELENEIDFIENELVNIENCNNVDDLSEIYEEVKKQGYIKGQIKNAPFEKKSEPYKFKSSDGFLIYVGKNNRQNDLLTLKKARPDDMWFHTKDIPGSHVILESKAGFASEKAITEACMLAAYFSKAKNGSNVPVDYTLKKYVRKPKGAKPGFVIYDHHKTKFVTPDKSIIEKLFL